jgi:putative spermidine/putrescine transport system permease protein
MIRMRFSWLGFLTFIVLMFTITPFLVIIPSSFTSENFVSFPPKGFSIHWFSDMWSVPGLIDSLLYSLQLASITALLSSGVGTLAALCIKRYEFRGKKSIQNLLMSPISLPSLVIGIATLIYFSNIGMSGTFAGLLLVHMIITIPYVIRFVLTGLATFDNNLEKAASIMGAKPVRAFIDITLPIIKPAVISGMVFSFLISFDNVTVSLFLVSPQKITLPLVIFNQIQENLSPVISAISTMVILLSLIPVIILEKVYGLDRLFGLNTNAD